jgi:hypothetical protein
MRSLEEFAELRDLRHTSFGTKYPFDDLAISISRKYRSGPRSFTSKVLPSLSFNFFISSTSSQ